MRTLILGALLVSSLSLPVTATAAESHIFNAGGGIGTEIESETGLGNTNPATATGVVINIVLSFLLMITLVLFIYAGVTWMTAAGNEEKISQAQGILKAAVVGILIILLSASLARFIVSQIGTASGAKIELEGEEAGTSDADAESVWGPLE